MLAAKAKKNKKIINNDINNQSAFSLIELLVAIAILVTLTSVFVANFQAQRNNLSVSGVANQLVSDLHKLQSFSLSSKDIIQGSPASSYSITFNNNTTSYNTVGYNNAIPPVPSNLSTINFPPNVKIAALQVTKTDSSNVAPAAVAVTFKIPYGRVLTNYAGSITNEVNDITRIKISSADNAVCSYVFVNAITGNITAQTACP
jgi:prepilin-type N-terminal cleavage/methylation domain-containing protein